MSTTLSAPALPVHPLLPDGGAPLAATRFLNCVDVPASVHYSQHGQAQVTLDQNLGPIINVAGFRRVSIRIGPTAAKAASIVFGKISNTTLAGELVLPLDHKIHTFDIIGPEMVLWLSGATPNSTENVQLWAYLST